MIVRIDPEGAVTLSQPDDFKRFHCEIDSAQADWQALRQRVRGVDLESPEAAWVDMTALLDLGAAAKGDEAPSWREQALRMIEGARKYGWVREEPAAAVRSHIVWQA